MLKTPPQWKWYSQVIKVCKRRKVKRVGMYECVCALVCVFAKQNPEKTFWIYTNHTSPSHLLSKRDSKGNCNCKMPKKKRKRTTRKYHIKYMKVFMTTYFRLVVYLVFCCCCCFCFADIKTLLTLMGYMQYVYYYK